MSISTSTETTPADIRSSSSSSTDDLLLSAPYYVYSYEDLLFWDNATLGGIPLKERLGIESWYHWSTKKKNDNVPRQHIHQRMSKHDDDYWLLQASSHHPMRVNDPSKAKLFFVPLLMNLYESKMDIPDLDEANKEKDLKRYRQDIDSMKLCTYIKSDI